MKTVTMLDFRRNAAGLLRRVAKGERFVLSHRGKPAARLEPLNAPAPADPATDPFLAISARAIPSPKGRTNHADIDRILYGRSWMYSWTVREWSLTDCTSFAVMRELRVRDAFTTDGHFKQAGLVPLLKA